jgi:hypothetical protein
MAQEYGSRALSLRCNNYGLNNTSQIAVFSHVADLLGEHFDVEPENDWAREVLRDPDLNSDRRAALLLALAELLAEERKGG